MYPLLKKYCEALLPEIAGIDPARKRLLDKVATYVTIQLERKEPVNLVYICTHNSRRSHFGQVWAAVAAYFYQVSPVSTFSGGTVATAFHPNAIAALKRAGFSIETDDTGSNPHYKVCFAGKAEPLVCYSKIYNDVRNPKTGFAAIMTCGEAEKDCSFVPGAAIRVATTYEDPKAYDNTPQQEAQYDARCRQIALESFYVFSEVSRKLNSGKI